MTKIQLIPEVYWNLPPLILPGYTEKKSKLFYPDKKTNCFSSFMSDLKGYLLGEAFSKHANYPLLHFPGSEP